MKFKVTRQGVRLTLGPTKKGWLHLFFQRCYVKDRGREMVKVSLFLTKPDAEKPDWITFSYLSFDEFREFLDRSWMKVSGFPFGSLDYRLLKEIRSS